MFTIWYIGRYSGGFVLAINTTIVIALAASLAYAIVMALRDRRASAGINPLER